jgi:hypothetical protein
MCAQRRVALVPRGDRELPDQVIALHWNPHEQRRARLGPRPPRLPLRQHAQEPVPAPHSPVQAEGRQQRGLHGAQSVMMGWSMMSGTSDAAVPAAIAAPTSIIRACSGRHRGSRGHLLLPQDSRAGRGKQYPVGALPEERR